MRKFVIATSVAALFASGAVPAFAKEMYCNVNENYKTALDGKSFSKSGTTYQLKVRNTYSGVPDSINSKDYNKYVNVKWGTQKTSSQHTNVMARPRTSAECMNAIYNEDKKAVWSGAWCDTSKHKETSKDFSIMKSEDGSIYMMGGAVNTTSKQNQFLGLYSKSGDTYTQIGGCAEHK